MKIVHAILAFLAFTAFCAVGSKPADRAFKAGTDGSHQRYLELLPPDFDPAKAHDLVLVLHGHGADRWQFINDPRDECRGVRDVATRFRLIVASPDYRAKTSWMGPLAEADVVQIIAELKQRHKVGRVFVAGASMGATAALTFTALHPDLVAGVCSLNGTANLLEYNGFQEAINAAFGGGKSDVPNEYKKRSAELWPWRFTMPVAFTTGGNDVVVPPQSVLRLVGELKKAGRKVLSIHREVGVHSTNYDDTCAAMEFMLREAGAAVASGSGPVLATLPENDRRDIETRQEQLAHRIKALKASAPDLLADAEVFHKSVEWALRYETNLAPKDLAMMKKAIARGMQRADALLANQAPWSARKGSVLRGFVSAVDGSTQPYGVIVPAGYDGTKPMRLDVVLHGSSKPVGLSEVRFGARFDEGDDAAITAPKNNFIELHPLGRVENCYRWAGETDVFEAIEAVCRNYRIDRDRIVLRGMSMGASGTWHLGLKHPDRFVAIGPYCGYVDTHRFSETPVPGFIKVGPLPPHQELGLHLLDSVDYAANASVVPTIAAIGDKDVFFQSHVHMGQAFAKEGLQLVNLISPGTAHVIDPLTQAEQMRRIGEFATAGIDHAARSLHFVTWTLKYNRCHWLELLALAKHYERAEISAKVDDDGTVEITDPKNITQFTIHPPMLQNRGAKLRIDGVNITLPAQTSSFVLAKQGDQWRCLGAHSNNVPTGKRPGLQGPIDDAFSAPFLCVRGTGKPWNPVVGAWADANLRRFAYEWARYLRGNLPVKDDKDVTEEDVHTKNLILFGDPGSNKWIRRTLPYLPVKWTRTEVRLVGEAVSSKNHAPVFICASPLQGAGAHYLVINSGHTFHEKEFATFNYLLFPRLGDWAVMKVQLGGEAWQPTSPTFPEEVVRAGFFDEQWKAMP